MGARSRSDAGADSAGAGPRGLIDSGAIVALIHTNDPWHGACVKEFERLHLPLATTTAVLAEVFHFAGKHPRGVAAAWKLVRSGAIVVLPIVGDDLASLERLMSRYADRPMDFADATLVHVAKRESLSTILTIDHDDFETYRIHGKKRFRVVPPRTALESTR